jgi:hypothetical protein
MTGMPETAAAADRLEALLPELEYSRQTHIEWRDCSQEYRDRNPQIGNAEFHDSCVKDYDERIAAITEAAALLRRLHK